MDNYRQSNEPESTPLWLSGATFPLCVLSPHRNTWSCVAVDYMPSIDYRYIFLCDNQWIYHTLPFQIF